MKEKSLDFTKICFCDLMCMNLACYHRAKVAYDILLLIYST
jgi:hypothetical protein